MQAFRRLLAAGFAALPALVLPAGAQPAIMEDVPYVTSPDNVTLEMLRVAQVGPGDHVIDLGSGDGRIVILAARRFGATGLGVEIVPDLVEQSIRHARDAGVAERVAFRVQDLFETDLSAASVVTMYLLPDVNLKLRPALLRLKPGTRLVSHDWDMGDWKPDQTTVVPVPDKKVGREKFSRIHFWVVPAPVDGLWCGAGPLREFSLRIAQHFQLFTGSVARRDRVRPFGGRIDGATVRTHESRQGALVLEAAGDVLRVVDGSGPLAMARGQSFTRAAGSACAG